MLLEIDNGRRSAQVEVEEFGGGQVVEVAVVEAEVGLCLLLLVRGDGVEVGQIRRHVGCPAAGEVGHCGLVWTAVERRSRVRVRRRVAVQSAPTRTGGSGSRFVSLSCSRGVAVAMGKRQRPATKAAVVREGRGGLGGSGRVGAGEGEVDMGNGPAQYGVVMARAAWWSAVRAEGLRGWARWLGGLDGGLDGSGGSSAVEMIVKRAPASGRAGGGRQGEIGCHRLRSN